MKTSIFFILGLITLTPNIAKALEAGCAQMADKTLCEGGLPTQTVGVKMNLDGGATMPGCGSMSTQCWEIYAGTYAPWYTCNTCQSGYTRTLTSATMSGCGTSSYYYCKENCNGCTDCTSDTSWTASGTGYQKKVTRTCNCNICNETTSYRCAAGYYGSSTNGTSGCTICPSDNSMTGTSTAGSTSITSCYIVVGDQIEDSTGTYEYTSNCYYTN